MQSHATLSYSSSGPRPLNPVLISQRKWARDFGGRAHLRQRRYSNCGAFDQWGWCSRHCGKVGKPPTFPIFHHFVPFVRVHDVHRLDFQGLQSGVIFLGGYHHNSFFFHLLVCGGITAADIPVWFSPVSRSPWFLLVGTNTAYVRVSVSDYCCTHLRAGTAKTCPKLIPWYGNARCVCS